MSVKFYIGCHQPADARFFPHCCINFSRLQNRKYRRGFSPQKWILDAGTFAGLAPNLKEYADAAHRWSWCGILEAVVAPDLLCLPQHLQNTGLSVYQHQAQTIANYDVLRELVKTKIYVMAVLQGLNSEDYKQHLCDYGNRLSSGAWVGIGSLSGRKPDTIAGILQIIYRLIIRTEGIRMLVLSEVEGLKADGSAVSAVGGEVRPKMGRKSNLRHSPLSTEAPAIVGTPI